MDINKRKVIGEMCISFQYLLLSIDFEPKKHNNKTTNTR